MIWEILAGGIAGGLLVLLWPRGSNVTRQAEQSWRRTLVDCARAHADAGTLYQWGGGHGWRDPEYGLDCSGLATSCAREAGFDVHMTADMIYKQLPEVAVPGPGDFAVYGSSSKANHVRVVEEWFPEEGRASTVGAEGAGSKVNDPAEAERRNMRVKRVPDHRAANFLGFRTIDGYAAPDTPRRSVDRVVG